MDECRNSPCGEGAQCTNIPGGYRCACANGFQRNNALPATLFQSIDPTSGDYQLVNTQPQPQPLQATASNNNTSSTLQQLVACIDIDECATLKTACGTNAQCINTAGGYFCQCPPGFSGNPKLSCADVDECASRPCGPNSICENSPGSFTCQCKSGFSGEQS